MALSNKEEISININCYLIKFRKRNIKDLYYKVSEVFLNKTFPQIRQNLITFLETKTYKNDPGDRILYIDRIISTKDTYYSGVLKKGYSGQESYIDELTTNKANTVTTVYANQFNSSPFYFLLAQPEVNSTYLIFLSQSYKQFGFKELFEEAFKRFYKDTIGDDFICEFSTLSIASLFEKYINDGDIRKIRFKKHGLTQNTENLLSDEERTELENYEMELSVLARKKGFLGIKKKIITENSSFIETVKIQDFDYDEVFADVSFNGRKRVLNITRPEDFSASYDLTDKAEINPNTKHPNFDTLNKEVISLLMEEIIPNVDK